MEDHERALENSKKASVYGRELTHLTLVMAQAERNASIVESSE